MTVLESQKARLLSDGWLIANCAPGAGRVDDLNSMDWLPAVVPGTVAENLIRNGQWTVDRSIDLDSQEYWFRCEFAADPTDGKLQFDGLATLAEVWVNDKLVLSADNMFRSYTVDVASLLYRGAGRTNKLIVRFASLAKALDAPRSRAKWRTNLGSHRNLRFFRTSLLGHMPGICPPIAPIGPWKSVRLMNENTIQIVTCGISPRINGEKGEIQFELKFDCNRLKFQSAHVLVDKQKIELAMDMVGDTLSLSGFATVPDVEFWWPHTHGEPRRYSATLVLEAMNGVTEFQLPPIGFRTVELAGDISDFALKVNGVAVHCRGACWMPLDIISLNSDIEQLRETLNLVRSAGMNMVRIPGITFYESDGFYALCDELGIMVWQDFMFASFDYPTDDDSFIENVRSEVECILARIGYRPCLTVACGGSEIQQQVAMLGLSKELSANEWFDETLPAICKSSRPDIVYVSHSPSGGALPFHADEGVSHYFAVGGYKQPIVTAQLEPPTFATECLAFSIPPEPDLIERHFTQAGNIRWDLYDSSIPVDNGSDWHFGEVTDHYIKEWFSIDPTELRARDYKLYLNAARIAVGEVMKRSVETWRMNDKTNGALILTLRDLSVGAGWGLLDSHGVPKAPYYFVKRAWQPVSLYFRDRGTNGLRIGLCNDTQKRLKGRLELSLKTFGGRVVEHVSVNRSCDPVSNHEWSVDELLGGFVDSSYAYQFGPRLFDIAAASFENEVDIGPITATQVLNRSPLSKNSGLVNGLSCEARKTGPSCIELSIQSDTFLDYVILQCPDAFLSDNYFCLLASEKKTVQIRSNSCSSVIGCLSTLGSPDNIPISLAEERR